MDVLQQVIDLRSEVLRASDLDAVLQPMIKRQPLKKLDDVALKRRAHLRLYLLRELGLLLDLLQMRREVAKGKIFLRSAVAPDRRAASPGCE